MLLTAPVFVMASFTCLVPAAAVGSQVSSPSAITSLGVLPAGEALVAPIDHVAPGSLEAGLQPGTSNGGALLRREVREEMAANPEDAPGGPLDAAVDVNAKPEAPVSANGTVDLDFATLLQGNVTSFIETLHEAGRINSEEREVVMEYLDSLQGQLPSAAQFIHKAADWLAGATEIVPEDYPFACRCDNNGKCMLDQKFNTSCIVRPGQGADGAAVGSTNSNAPIELTAPPTEAPAEEGESSLLQRMYSFFQRT